MNVSIPVPTSKSMTQRALVLAALASGPSSLVAPLDCDDSRHLRSLLEAFGATFETLDGGRILSVRPATLPLRAPTSPLRCGNAGTAVRFGAALSLLADGAFIIDGDEHMRQRPIGPLASALTSLGVAVEFLRRPGCPPLRLTRRGRAPLRAQVDGSVSSQFASALMLVAPALEHGLELELAGMRVSTPYLAMTMAMLKAAGCDAEWIDDNRTRLAPGRPRGGESVIEGDWSAAAFILAAAQITGISFVPEGLLAPTSSLQGDAAVVSLLATLAAPDGRHAISLDLTDCPDLLPPLVVAALFSKRPTSFTGVAHARVKECDRVAVLAREFSKLGATLRVDRDSLHVSPIESCPSDAVVLDPHDDHRMAMAFGVASLRVRGLEVSSRDCVSKSFPGFWTALDTMRRAVDRAPNG